jgi:hypothetical protein
VVERRYADEVTAPHRTVAVDDDIMDFSSERESIKFRVDHDVFEASPDIAAELALDFADLIEQLDEVNDNQKQKEVMHALFRLVLFPESAERFIERLSDPRHPIGQRRIGDIVKWLFEQYGARPTEPDSASLTGSESQDAGTSSTASTSDAAST